MSLPEVRMVQALCGNLKMAFDSAKVNFLEARNALQVFHRLLKKLEKLEQNRQNGDDVEALKRMMENIKGSVSFLQTKLTKNSDTAKEGFKLLQDRLTKINGILDMLCTKKRKLEDGFHSYKRLRTGLDWHTSLNGHEQLSNRKQKINSLEKAIETTNMSISNVNIEKEALTETCCKMEDFLDSTKGFIMQLRNRRIIVSNQGVNLSNWFKSATHHLKQLSHPFCSLAVVMANSSPSSESSSCAPDFADLKYRHVPLMEMRNHIVNASTIVFEFPNPPEYPISAPRLILTAKFMKLQRGSYPYALMHAEVNHDSVDCFEAIEYAIHKNDLQSLLTRVRALWEKHFFLLNEIVLLRERYPVDWKVNERKVCVLLGNRVNITCTFNIPKDYPSSGTISVEKIEGLSSETNVEDLKPDGVQPTFLTMWIDHLAERFHNV